MSAVEGEEDFAAESAVAPPVWQVGDRVRIVGGAPQLLGAVGTVVEVSLPGRWPVRVEVERRRGFGQVLRAADELASEDEATS
ncbi:hypothetical protein GCM10027059_42650 [Myceligenerans halotolerans]